MSKTAIQTGVYRCHIKLCGLKTQADIETANSLDIWAVGFVLTGSPRQISPSHCRHLSSMVRPEISKVGVFVSENIDEIAQLMEYCQLDYAQAYGPYPDDCWPRFYSLPGLRAVRVKDESSLDVLKSPDCHRFFLDAYVKGLPGGSGHAFDWALAEKAKNHGEVILAGGLNPDNVGTAITRVRPWGVDVSSGIEKEKGIKDHALMRTFVEQVKNAEATEKVN